MSSDGISISITEDVTKVEVTEDVTTINITPSVTTVEAKGISIANASAATAVTYQGSSNTLGTGGNVAASLDHINTNGLNKNLDQTIDGNITFADGHTITFPTSGYTALELNDNSMNVAGITASADITSATKMEAPLFKGDLEGAVHFKASGSGLAKGDVVYITGYQGNKTTVDKADASDSAKMPAFGIVNATQGGNVDILTFGSMLHLSTTGIATGTELYVSASTPGGYETSAPTGEGNLVQKIAKVVRGDSNSGSIKIMGAGRTNATPNLNSGNIFLGNVSNISTTASFDTTFASSFATRTTDDLTEGTNNFYYTDAKADARVNSVLGTGVDNIVTTGYLRGPSTFRIDPAGHGDNSGKVIIAGDLQVDGTTTTINSQYLTVDDLAITLASGAPDAVSANGAGIVVDGANASFVYSSDQNVWLANKGLFVYGDLYTSGAIKDSLGSSGTAGQALLSTGTGTDWGNISTTLNISADSGNSEAINMLTETLDIEGVAPISTVTGTNKVSISLDDVGSSGTFGGSQTIPQITVDTKGRITSVSEISGQVGPKGDSGATGAEGLSGSNGGATLEYGFTPSVNFADAHTATNIQLNKWDYTLTGLRLRISSTDDEATNVKDFVRYMTSSTNPNEKGFITITNAKDPSRYLLLRITTEAYEIADDDITVLSVERVAGLTGGANLSDTLVGSTLNPNMYVSFQKGADFGQFSGLDDFAEVDLTTTTPTDDDVLVWDTDKFVPKKPENQYITVNSGAGVVAGYPYAASGFYNDHITVTPPDADGAGQMPIIGFATETVAGGTITQLLSYGLIKDHNTRQYDAEGLIASATSTHLDHVNDVIYFENAEAANFSTGDRVTLRVGYSGQNPNGQNFPSFAGEMTQAETFVRFAGSTWPDNWSGYKFYNTLDDALSNTNHITFTNTDAADAIGENFRLRSNEQTKYLFASPFAGKLRRIKPKLNFTETQQVATLINLSSETAGAILVDVGAPLPVENLSDGEFSFGTTNGDQKASFSEQLKRILNIGRYGEPYITFSQGSGFLTPVPKITTVDGTLVNDSATSVSSSIDMLGSIIWGNENENQGHTNAMFGGESSIASGNNYNIVGGLSNTVTNTASHRNIIVGNENNVDGSITDYVVAGEKNKVQNTSGGAIFGVNNLNVHSNGGFINARNGVNYTAHYSITCGSHDMGADDLGTNTSATQPNICHWNGGIHTAIFGKSNTASIASDGSFICGEQNRVGADAITQYQLRIGDLGSTKEFPYENASSNFPTQTAKRSFVAGSHNTLLEASWTTVGGYNNSCDSDKSFIFGANNQVGTAGGNHVQGLLGEGLESPQYLDLLTGAENIGTGQVVVGKFNSPGNFDAALRVSGWFSNNTHTFSVGTGTDDANRYTSFVVVPRQTDTGKDFSGIGVPALKDSASYSSDQDASAGGVPVGGLYRSGNTIKTRLADNVATEDHTVHIVQASLTGTEFLELNGKRLVKVSTGGTLNFALPQPSAQDIGKSWTVVNADFGGSSSTAPITLDLGTQYVRFMDGSSTQGTRTDFKINSSGIADIICIAANASGGTSSTPNFIIYGSGISQ